MLPDAFETPFPSVKAKRFAQLGDTAEQLIKSGLSASEAGIKADLFAQCARVLADLGSGDAADLFALFVPGRIEFLGKHTDYGGGRSLIDAAERGICAVIAPRNDATVRMVEATGSRRVEFAIHPELKPQSGQWSNYPMTVARRLARNFGGKLRGADIVFTSNLPPASGMSSSSVLVVLSYLILNRINGISEREEYRRNIKSMEDLGGYLGTVENGQSFGSLAGDKGVGTFGGSEDHTAILCCKHGLLSQYSFCPVKFEREVPLGEDLVLAVGVSGVIAEKTGDAQEKFNRASRITGEIVRLWNGATGRKDPHISAALTSARMRSSGSARSSSRRTLSSPRMRCSPA